MAFNSPLLQDVSMTSVRAYWYNGMDCGPEIVPSSTYRGLQTTPLKRDRRRDSSSGGKQSHIQPHMPSVAKSSPVVRPSPKPVAIVPGLAIRAAKEKRTREQAAVVKSTPPAPTVSPTTAATSKKLPLLKLNALESITSQRSTNIPSHSDHEPGETVDALSEQPLPIGDFFSRKSYQPPTSSSGFRSGSLVLNCFPDFFEVPPSSVSFAKHRPSYPENCNTHPDLPITNTQVSHSEEQQNSEPIVQIVAKLSLSSNISRKFTADKIKVGKDEIKLVSLQRAEQMTPLKDIPQNASVKSTQFSMASNTARLLPRSPAQYHGRLDLKSSGRSADAVLVPSKKLKIFQSCKSQVAANAAIQLSQDVAAPVLSATASSSVSVERDTAIGLGIQVSEKIVSTVQVVSEDVKSLEKPVTR